MDYVKFVGLDAVSEFFSGGFADAKPRPTPTGPVVTTAGTEAAMPFTLRLSVGDGEVTIDVIDVMEFDSEGKIRRLRAFWNPREMRKVGEAGA